MKLASFIEKYDNIIFDMDGVITSEQNYWTVAALNAWEWIHKDCGFSVSDAFCNASKIRAEVMCDDKLIGILKNKGVNSNWDLCYIIYAMTKILDTNNFEKVMKACESFSDNILDEYPVIAKRLSEIEGRDASRNNGLWTELMMTYQAWYLGDELFEAVYKKKPHRSGYRGFIHSEKPIIKSSALIEIFSLLSKKGKRLATATGRPSNELMTPLKDFGIFDYFDKAAIINYDHIENAEKSFKKTLAKPHPYIFIKAMLGESFDDEKILSGKYNKDAVNRTLIVGDAGSDILAAKAMGADFCAVLTGVSGKSARSYFEALKSQYILDSLENFLV